MQENVALNNEFPLKNIICYNIFASALPFFFINNPRDFWRRESLFKMTYNFTQFLLVFLMSHIFYLRVSNIINVRPQSSLMCTLVQWLFMWKKIVPYLPACNMQFFSQKFSIKSYIKFVVMNGVNFWNTVSQKQLDFLLLFQYIVGSVGTNMRYMRQRKK